VWPRTIVTRDFGTPRALATNLVRAMFAAPPTGGAVTRARSGSPASSWSRSARGVMRTARSTWSSGTARRSLAEPARLLRHDRGARRRPDGAGAVRRVRRGGQEHGPPRVLRGGHGVDRER